MTAFRKGRLQGLSCLKGNFHEQFLGGWVGAIPPGYPADARELHVRICTGATGNRRSYRGAQPAIKMAPQVAEGAGTAGPPARGCGRR